MDTDCDDLQTHNKLHLLGVKPEDIATVRAVPGLDWGLFLQFVDKRAGEAEGLVRELAAMLKGVAKPKSKPKATPEPEPEPEPEPRSHHGKKK